MSIAPALATWRGEAPAGNAVNNAADRAIIAAKDATRMGSYRGDVSWVTVAHRVTLPYRPSP